ncbi:MAG: bifunctional phosphopantothenoylcysteine decarboxylase/phosphopantothenate--cysteine ligase CoaBC [Candidatus Marinimicrobia bacterium]|nr:bifunctional phosphopantothenoylcysteine decarboxylase/phosphopantothenate--cysteine ligase CoaBC [Candidatus Neomarinimicrobiota bacterium]
MSILRGKNILLGLSGGIAIYKSASLLRRLTRDHGCNVTVVMTRSAQAFMTPLVFETFSGKEVITEMFESRSGIVGTRHIDLVQQADLIAVIPASANIIGKICAGIADDALSTMLIAARPEKTLIAPAMNHNMYNHPVMQRNLAQLRGLSYNLIEPETGELATAEEGWGVGRLPDEKTLLFYLEKACYAQKSPALRGKKVLVSGGPTREALDDIRFISNPSSGKMGIALAESAAKQGAKVVYVSGPSSLPDPLGCETIRVVSAEAMKTQILQHFEEQDIVAMAAAVEDIRPKVKFAGKLKKQAIPEQLPLERTPDILALLGKNKKKQLLVGFSVEVEKGIEHSLKKLREKNLDLIVLNDPGEPGAAFAGDTNRITLITPDGKANPLPLKSKEESAEAVWEQLLKPEA